MHASADRTATSPVVGLTAEEARASLATLIQAQAGAVDLAPAEPAGTYAEAEARARALVRTNVFSFYNTILFVIGAALLVLGRYSDALISVGLGLINAMISAAQEIRAKRKLDHLHLLDRAPVLVVRDGTETEMSPDDVVRGDTLRVRAGDQIDLFG